jgi:hypothetical protein
MARAVREGPKAGKIRPKARGAISAPGAVSGELVNNFRVEDRGLLSGANSHDAGDEALSHTRDRCAKSARKRGPFGKVQARSAPT